MTRIKIEVRLIGDSEFELYKLPSDSRIEDLLVKLGKNVETVVVKRNENIVPEEETLEDGDKIIVIPVVSGG